MSGPATEKACLPNCVLLRLTAAARVLFLQAFELLCVISGISCSRLSEFECIPSS